MVRTAVGLLAVLSLQAADFSFTIPGRGQVQLADLRGKVVLLQFIYSSCKPCLTEASRFQAIAQRFSDKGIISYAIAFDPNAAYMLHADKARSPLEGWASGEAVRSFLHLAMGQIVPVPQIVILDRSGEVRYRTGIALVDALRNEDTITARLESLLVPHGEKAGQAR